MRRALWVDRPQRRVVFTKFNLEARLGKHCASLVVPDRALHGVTAAAAARTEGFRTRIRVGLPVLRGFGLASESRSSGWLGQRAAQLDGERAGPGLC
jgi:hypothetical protein